RPASQGRSAACSRQPQGTHLAHLRHSACRGLDRHAIRPLAFIQSRSLSHFAGQRWPLAFGREQAPVPWHRTTVLPSGWEVPSCLAKSSFGLSLEAVQVELNRLQDEGNTRVTL